MERGNWKRPVILEIFGRPGLLTVSDTLDAALVLLGVWPSKRSHTHMVAVKTCRDVLVGKAVPALARADFIDAALEAGFQVQPETFLEEIEQKNQPELEIRTGTGSRRHIPFRGPMIALSTRPATPAPRTFRDARLPQDWHRHANSNSSSDPQQPHSDEPTLRQLFQVLTATIAMIAIVGSRKTTALVRKMKIWRTRGRERPENALTSQ